MGDLARARALASRVRLSEDRSSPLLTAKNFVGRSSHRDTMLRNGLLVSRQVTPLIEERLSGVCHALDIPRNSVTAFVYNDPNVQADCLIDSQETCVLRFSSGLINLMSSEEFRFVCGHELAHFLYGHGATEDSFNGESLEGYMVKRAMELSADRIGFLSTDDVEHSIKAIMKTASGLSNELLRFDVAGFLSQTNLIASPSSGEHEQNSHPSMLIRCRSLLWFSMVVSSRNDLDGSNEKEIDKVNQRVVNDLERLVDGQVRLRKSRLLEDVALWKAVLLIYHEGTFDKDSQRRLSGAFGKEILQSVIEFFALYERTELCAEITSRLESLLSHAAREFPSSAREMENEAFERAYQII
jgi:hypothetical protein